MKTKLLLLVSLMMIILSSFGLATFIRLKSAEKTYTTEDSFNDACHVSKNYVHIGLGVNGAILVLSFVVLGVALYK